MNLLAAAALSATVINAGLAGFVLFANPRSTLSRTYAAWGGCVALWNLAASFAYLEETTQQQAEVWLRILQAAVIFLPLTLVHLCRIVVDGKAPRWLRWMYLLHGAMVLSLFGPWFMSGVQKLPVGWWGVAGPLFWVYLASYSFLTFPLLLGLPGKAASAPPLKGVRIRSLWFSILALWILGSNDLVPILGSQTYPGTKVTFIPLGNIGAIFYGIVVAYSVLQHQLLDIHLALSRLAASIARLAFIIIIGFSLLFAAQLLMPDSFTQHGFIAALAALVASIALAGILFPKLLGGSTENIERALLGDRFELPEKVRAFIAQMRWHTETTPLIDELEKFLTGAFRLRRFALITLDETRRAYTCCRAIPEGMIPATTEFRGDSAVFAHFLSSPSRILTVDRGYGTDNEHPYAERACAELEAYGADFAFGLVHDGNALGFILLSNRAGGRKLTASDLTLLSDLAENLALFLHQTSLKRQVLLNQELDLLGRMSRGLAHDLNNLTTPVWTMLQLLGEGVSQETLRNELVPIAIRNIETMRAYIKEALFFSENLRPDLQPGRLDSLIEALVENARQVNRKGKAIKYILSTGGEALIEMDEILIQRLLTNLLANAVDASPPGSEIRVELIRLNRTEPTRDWLRISVKDHGTGIKSEDLNRIFQPYFTTKKTGDEDRGFGLGLAICRKIASLHGGHLTVQSEFGKGTTVNLDLPNRQKQSMTAPFTPSPLVEPAPQPTGP